MLRYHSINILSYKLDEGLHDKAKFFFCIKGATIAEPAEKQITNLELLQDSFCSLTSLNCPKFTQILEHSIEKEDENDCGNIKEPHCIVLGTFYDKLLQPGFSGELLDSKNSILWSTLEELTLYFPLTSILVIKKVGVIPNDEYTRRLLYTEFGALVCFVEASFLASRASGSWVGR